MNKAVFSLAQMDGCAEPAFHSGCTHPFSWDDHSTLLADVDESVTDRGGGGWVAAATIPASCIIWVLRALAYLLPASYASGLAAWPLDALTSLQVLLEQVTGTRSSSPLQIYTSPLILSQCEHDQLFKKKYYI